MFRAALSLQIPLALTGAVWYILFLIGLLLFVLLIAFLIRSGYERSHFSVSRYEVASPKVTPSQDGYTVVMLADLHNNEFGPKNVKLTRAIAEERPDLVLIAGDSVTVHQGHDVDLTTFRNLLEGLKDIDCPVYFTRGNHEDRLADRPEVYPGLWDEMQKIMDRFGVITINNEQIILPPKKGNKEGTGPVLASYQIPGRGYRKMAPESSVNAEEIRAAIGEPLSHTGEENDPFVILSAHSPLFGNAYSEWGADLTLCGHFHGGTIRLPFLGGLMTPQFHFFRGRDRGMYLLKDAPDGPKVQITSGGLGTHSVNLRFRNLSDLVVVKLKRKVQGDTGNRTDLMNFESKQ